MNRKCGINAGSGQRPFTSTPEIEWINLDKVDRRPEMPLDLLSDALHIEAALDGSIDYFVLHHVLEHLWTADAERMVREAHRVLKPGGSLLVFVPNMQVLASRWLGGEISTQIYMTNVYGAYMGNVEDRHAWGFDPLSLSEFLWNACKWEAMKPFDWRQISGASLCRDWWIMAAECVR